LWYSLFDHENYELMRTYFVADSVWHNDFCTVQDYLCWVDSEEFADRFLDAFSDSCFNIQIPGQQQAQWEVI